MSTENKAILVRALRSSGGQIKILLEDVERQGSAWGDAKPFAEFEVSEEELRSEEIEEEELIDLGMNLIQRLLAPK